MHDFQLRQQSHNVGRFRKLALGPRRMRHFLAKTLYATPPRPCVGPRQLYRRNRTTAIGGARDTKDMVARMALHARNELRRHLVHLLKHAALNIPLAARVRLHPCEIVRAISESAAPRPPISTKSNYRHNAVNLVTLRCQNVISCTNRRPADEE